MRLDEKQSKSLIAPIPQQKLEQMSAKRKDIFGYTQF